MTEVTGDSVTASSRICEQNRGDSVLVGQRQRDSASDSVLVGCASRAEVTVCQ